MEKIKKVLPQDYTEEQVLQLFRAGKLYIETSLEYNLEEVINNVREYVKRINSLVTSRFRTSIDALWDDIFHCEDLCPLLMPGSKNSKSTEFNKVGVKGIICIMINNGIYTENYSCRKIDNMLEQSEIDTSSRRYLALGIKDDSLRRIVSKIVKKYIN
jgi:uncharacterized protein YlzI (FlbEa/FlbD family)